jgi:hypothetical protein
MSHDGVLRVLERCRGLFPEACRLSFVDDANAGEWGIALEGVCAYLDEYAAIVGDELFSEIERLATAMQLNDDCWKRLERTPYRD